jgi:putative membrane protein insertion efficiency factor
MRSTAWREWIHDWVRSAWLWPRWGLVAAVRVYQRLISPWLGNNCRFVPSCSQYFVESVQQRGAIAGSWRGVCRICRCHPWHPGGWDPP